MSWRWMEVDFCFMVFAWCKYQTAIKDNITSFGFSIACRINQTHISNISKQINWNFA